MKITIKRTRVYKEATMGRLFCQMSSGATFECETLEPHPSTGKLISCGTYFVKITWSPKFKRMMPLVDNVPGRCGIRFHPGNTAEDTDGCILVGLNGFDEKGRLWASRDNFDCLCRYIKGAVEKNEVVTLKID